MTTVARHLLLLLLIGCGSTEESAPAPQSSAKPPEALKWPRVHQAGGEQLLVYEPQIVGEWENYERLHANSALAVTAKDAKESFYGVLEYEVQTEVEQDTRTVLLKNRKVLEIRFPGLDAAKAKAAAAIVERLLPKGSTHIVPLDLILNGIRDQAKKAPSVKVNLEPPPLYASDAPAILVIFMGKPSFKAVTGLSIQCAINTNWSLFFEPTLSRYYLLHGEGWITTADLEKGPWTSAESVPGELAKLPAEKVWEDVRARVPGKHVAAPRVFVSHEPAELIVTEGAPKLEAIPGTSLSFVTNTTSELFQDSKDGTYYFLTSGRWFRSGSLQGPWKSASQDLPADFAKIPSGHEKADVLVSVPGTEEAADAVLLAQVPRRAVVDRSKVTLTVPYEGEPKFQSIEGTKVEYVLNTPYDVFRVAGRYYCCHEAVWFEASSPTGPWVVSTKVPAEIYSIPSTSPKYNVTYVRVYDYTETTVVVGYTSGYYGMYVSGGCVMFGIGVAMVWGSAWGYWHYPPWYYSYGCGAYYSFHYGGYCAGARYYGPYGGAGWGVAYNPYTGTYARGAYASGPGGSRYFAQAYNPYTGNYAARSGGSNYYSNWGRGVVSNGEDWARGGYYQDSRGTVYGGSNSEGGKIIGGVGNEGSGFVARGQDGDLYVGKDGNVYHKGDDGKWQQKGGERPTQQPTEPRRSEVQPQERTNLDTQERTRNQGWNNTMQRSRPSRGGGGRRR